MEEHARGLRGRADERFIDFPLHELLAELVTHRDRAHRRRSGVVAALREARKFPDADEQARELRGLLFREAFTSFCWRSTGLPLPVSARLRCGKTLAAKRL